VIGVLIESVSCRLAFHAVDGQLRVSGVVEGFLAGSLLTRFNTSSMRTKAFRCVYRDAKGWYVWVPLARLRDLEFWNSICGTDENLKLFFFRVFWSCVCGGLI
jgi:hypothetical protein